MPTAYYGGPAARFPDMQDIQDMFTSVAQDWQTANFQ
jgi:hypothetical protein